MKKIIVGRFGNREDQENYTHVLYEREEYLNAEKNLKETQTNLNRFRDYYSQSKEEVESLKEKIKLLEEEKIELNEILNSTINGQLSLNKRIKELEELNERLYEINRETINSKRDVKPKKEHSAYMIKGIFEKIFQIYGAKYDFFAYKLQTPYSIFLKKNEVRERIEKDLESYLLKDLGIKKVRVFYELSELKQALRKKVLENNSEEVYVEKKSLVLFNEFILDDFRLLIDFKLTGHNGDYWDIQFFSKDQLELNLNLIKINK
ncbi:hypothetical protein [Clostridium sp.]|uniref:hypothetical protein n=1 Tax=Clostridium sp. TaxID=1506 RepID=UPI00260F701C|nr:hypothetical protein [Clostridium sp.]